MLIPQEKILFIHIPRTGGTTIESYFRQNLIKKSATELYGKKCLPENEIYHLDGRQHYPLAYFEHKDRIDDYYIFTFVRHPYDRLISAYEYSFSKKYNFNTIVCILPVVTQFYRSFSSSYLCHLIPQHRFLTSNIDFDFIGRYERYKQDFQHLLSDLELPIKAMPHIFKTRKKPFKRYLNSFTQYFINVSYHKDFKLFGYKKLKNIDAAASPIKQ